MEKILDFNKQQRGNGLPSDLARVAKFPDRKHIEMLILKQMIQWLPIALAQVKSGNTSENLPTEIRKIIYSFHREKKLLKK